MGKFFAIVLLLVTCVGAQSSPSPTLPDGQLLKSERMQLPTFDSLPEIANYATASEYKEAVDDQRYVLERIEYASDGQPVSAYIYRPAKSAGTYPVIIFNRGSGPVKNQGPVLLTMFRRLATSGFVVVAPMLRGSDGMPGRDEMGGNERHDIVNIVPVIQHFEYADPKNVFMYGESRGGIMTLLAVQAGMPIKAAVTFGAITDMRAYLDANSREAGMVNKIWPDYEQNKDAILDLRSAQKWADKINAPILLMHGGKDPQVTPIHTLKMAEALTKAGKTYSVIIYADDNHILSAHRNERDQRAVEWFRSYMKPVVAQ
jgi:dipeptidyl aminopeptidase/acylaminoacyl peptidase